MTDRHAGHLLELFGDLEVSSDEECEILSSSTKVTMTDLIVTKLIKIELIMI